MRLPIWLTIIAAVVGVIIVFVAGTFILQPPTELILSAGFDDDTITPNADGDNDITTFRYELARNATVTIAFENDTGDIFYFRDAQPRTRRDYQVLFSGVVDGYLTDADPDNLALSLDDNPDAIIVERRLIPDGVYTWRLIAENGDEQQEVTGTLTITESDAELPLMTSFTLSSDIFTPNRDGINDRVTINIFLAKEADLRVFLLTENDVELPISQRVEWSCEDEEGVNCGRYTYDYEGGVDLNQTPPEDGTYTVIATAQDDEGQRVRRQTTLTIDTGGVPRAEISPQVVDADVFWYSVPYDERYFSDNAALGDLVELPAIPDAVSQNQISVPFGDMLVFRLTVNNYGDVPIRTTAPAVGAVYQQEQIASSLDALDEPGAWRVGVQCDTSGGTFPYRWAVGTADELITLTDPETGRDYTYLPENTSTVIWGAIRMTEINEFANPQTCWAGLIHEGVGISVENIFVGPIEVAIGQPPVNSTDSE